MEQDVTWDVTVKVRVTTYMGWKPERDDVIKWLQEGNLELVTLMKVEETK